MTFFNAVLGKVYNLMTHPYGFRVLQWCLEHVSPEQAILAGRKRPRPRPYRRGTVRAIKMF
jgi:Pumilio-family RNA binding repeat